MQYILKTTYWMHYILNVLQIECTTCWMSVYLNTTLNFEIPIALIYQSEIYYKVDRLLTGLTAQQIGTTGLLVLLLSNLYLGRLQNTKFLNSFSTSPKMRHFVQKIVVSRKVLFWAIKNAYQSFYTIYSTKTPQH